MPRFEVQIKEVHVVPVPIDAEHSPEEARQIAQDMYDNEKVDLEKAEFDAVLPPEYWDVLEYKDGKDYALPPAVLSGKPVDLMNQIPTYLKTFGFKSLDALIEALDFPLDEMDEILRPEEIESIHCAKRILQYLNGTP